MHLLSFVFIAFAIGVITIFCGFILTVVAWVNDFAKLEKVGIYITLAGAFMLLMGIGSCTRYLSS